MKAMLKAIQGKRQSYMPDDMDESGEEQGGQDLSALVSSLSDEQKAELLQMLQGETDRSTQIASGEASSEERGHIEKAIDEEDEVNAAQDDSAGERFPSAKPKNLSQRLIASAQKHMKGKL